MGAYYIYGTNVNPLATLVANFEAALYSVLRFYSLISWVVDAGALTCPGLSKISPEPVVHSFLNSTHTAYDFFHARNIWPYYHQSLGNNLACTTHSGRCFAAMLSPMCTTHSGLCTSLFVLTLHGAICFSC